LKPLNNNNKYYENLEKELLIRNSRNGIYISYGFQNSALLKKNATNGMLKDNSRRVIIILLDGRFNSNKEDLLGDQQVIFIIIKLIVIINILVKSLLE
jgi:hypothetical protein